MGRQPTPGGAALDTRRRLPGVGERRRDRARDARLPPPIHLPMEVSSTVPPPSPDDFLKSEMIYLWPDTDQQVAAFWWDEEQQWFLIPQPGNGLPFFGVDDDGLYAVNVDTPYEPPFFVQALRPTGQRGQSCPTCGETTWVGHVCAAD